MNIKPAIYPAILFGLLAPLLLNCKKEAIEPTVPTVTALPATNITANTAISGGEVTADGGANVTERGICWNISPKPTIANNKTLDGSGLGSFSSSIEGLMFGTAYYLRSYATNSVGTAYGNEISFTTTAVPATVSDVDGNVYHTVRIGLQVWMVENLKTTKYRNGEPIAYCTDNTEWSNLVGGAYSWLKNNIANKADYGALYNFYAVSDSRTIAPTGWRVANDKDWTTLAIYLGGEIVAGGKLKEAGTTHWTTPNQDATNETGFSALPGGYHHLGGTYDMDGISGYWWTSTPSDLGNGNWYRAMDWRSGKLTRMADLSRTGFSVRCIMN